MKLKKKITMKFGWKHIRISNFVCFIFPKVENEAGEAKDEIPTEKNWMNRPL